LKTLEDENRPWLFTGQGCQRLTEHSDVRPWVHFIHFKHLQNASVQKQARALVWESIPSEIPDTIIGHSAGCSTAVHFVLECAKVWRQTEKKGDFPIRDLVLVSPAPTSEMLAPLHLIWIMARDKELMWKGLPWAKPFRYPRRLAHLLGGQDLPEEQVLDFLKNYGTRWFPMVVSENMFSAILEQVKVLFFLKKSLRKRLREAGINVTVVYGDHDALLPKSSAIKVAKSLGTKSIRAIPVSHLGFFLGDTVQNLSDLKRLIQSIRNGRKNWVD
jgi:pimeloyl-ACP methyl ester carboxylesterase